MSNIPGIWPVQRPGGVLPPPPPPPPPSHQHQHQNQNPLPLPPPTQLTPTTPRHGLRPLGASGVALSKESQVRLVELAISHARKGTRAAGLTSFYNAVRVDLKAECGRDYASVGRKLGTMESAWRKKFVEEGLLAYSRSNSELGKLMKEWIEIVDEEKKLIESICGADPPILQQLPRRIAGLQLQTPRDDGPPPNQDLVMYTSNLLGEQRDGPTPQKSPAAVNNRRPQTSAQRQGAVPPASHSHSPLSHEDRRNEDHGRKRRRENSQDPEHRPNDHGDDRILSLISLMEKRIDEDAQLRRREMEMDRQLRQQELDLQRTHLELMKATLMAVQQQAAQAHPSTHCYHGSGKCPCIDGYQESTPP
ncbi:hypothetical protein Q7P37_007292 [Cladosporium fusiforme]